MKFDALGSGSKGNCYLIRSDTTNILVDSGISWAKINKRLKQLEVKTINAIFITHEHIDHIRSLETTIEKTKAEAYSSFGTSIILGIKTIDTEMQIGDITVKPINVSHDAVEPLGYVFVNGNKKISIITDTGYIEENTIEEIRTSDILAIESNYDETLINNSDYTFNLIERIKSDKGHLSNQKTAEYVVEMLKANAKCNEKRNMKIILLHLSHHSNTATIAYQAIRNKLFENGYFIGTDVNVEITTDDGIKNTIKA